MSDPYAILGVQRDASDDDIKAAFRRLAKEHHPDKNGGSKESEVRFNEVSTAYEQIKTADKRANQQNQNHGHPGGFEFNMGGFGFRTSAHANMEEMIREFQARANAPRNRNYATNCTIQLKDAFTGCEVALKMHDNREVRVKIPAGVDNGTKIRLGGVGEHVHTNVPAGDLIVTIHIPHDPIFGRQHTMLLSDVSIDAFDLMLGGKVSVPIIDGGSIDLEIAPGTQPDHQIRISGKGMPIINSTQRGDHIITVKANIPALTEEEKIRARQVRVPK